jgi:hypothetical protein
MTNQSEGGDVVFLAAVCGLGVLARSICIPYFEPGNIPAPQQTITLHLPDLATMAEVERLSSRRALK